MMKEHLCAVSARNEAIAEALAAITGEHIKQQNAKDMQGVLATMHAQSPWREATKSFLEPFFDHYTLQNTLLSCCHVGSDADYAYCRISLQVERIAGPEFPATRSENLLAFKRQGQDWKIWQQMILAALPLTSGGSAE